MKKLILFSLLMMGIGSSSNLSAQVQVNVNIGSQPLWGPVGYDRVDYYYLPDVEAYYSVPRRQFIYLGNNGKWIFSYSLPSRYATFNLYSGYKVVINSPTPYLYFKNHRTQYAKYRGWKGKQNAIKFSDNPKYYVVKGHPHGGAPGQAKKMPAPQNNKPMMDKGNDKGGKGKRN